MQKGAKDYLFVALQALGFIAFCLPVRYPLPQYQPFPVIHGFLMAFGVILVFLAFWRLRDNLTPWPTPKKNAELVQSGIFKLVRHPIYSGLFLFLAGWAFWQNNAYQLLLAVMLMVLFYFKSRYEETRLQIKFPEYAQYRKNTGRFFPRLKLQRS